MQETVVWSLSQEDPFEKGMETHSSILAWEIPWTQETGEIAVLPRSKCVLISWLQSPSTVIVEPNKICHCVHFFPFYLPRSDGNKCHDLIFLMLSFKPAFSLSFTLIKRLFSSSSLSAIRVVSSTCLRLLIFLLSILILAWDSSSPAFHKMYSAYQLNKHGDTIQPWHTPFPIFNQSVVPCPVLTIDSWHTHRCFRRQEKWSGIPISLRIVHS